MVFLAVNRSGYEAYRALGISGALWVGAGVLSDEELASLRRLGVDVTNFNYEIELHDSEVISGAVDTIKEHHPGEVLWMQS
jgi:hypothetical protein